MVTRRDEGDLDAQLAFDLMAHRIVGHVGTLAAVLGRVDAIAFTAGIGEHNPGLRAAVSAPLGLLDVQLDGAANADAHQERRISTTDNATAVWVVPTNEEWEIARQCAELLS